MNNSKERTIICVIGLGFVGLPVAEAFSRYFHVIGFDIDKNRLKELNLTNNNPNFTITNKPQRIREADFILITVPTPVTKSKDPDLSHIISASKTIINNMKAGCTVVI